MISLTAQKDYRKVRSLSFCYLCGQTINRGDHTNRDHVPPKSMFLPEHREPLVLRTHVDCNERWSKTDEIVGQLIGLQTGRVPYRSDKLRLDLVHLGALGCGGIRGIDLEQAVWRWVTGFYAALYKAPLTHRKNYIALPFTRLDDKDARYEMAQRHDDQHRLCVEILKQNRAYGSIDRIAANCNCLRFECVWGQSDNGGPWLCFFGLKIYEWQQLGSTPATRTQGCVGLFHLASGEAPIGSARVTKSSIIVPNYFPYDPFSP